jgi:hypothetical protein
MITRQNCFVSGGKTFATLEEAQISELESLFGDDGQGPWTANEIAQRILEKESQILDVLTTTETSKARARAINGGRKPRKPKQPTLPLEKGEAA